MALSFREKYSFGIGAFGKDIILAYVGVFLMIYFTDVLYLSPAFVGSLFFVARIWDAINDPVMGMIVDNTQGISSNNQNPFIALKRPETTETLGEAIGFSLVYSGNFLAQIEVDTYDVSRVSMGINPFGFTWHLDSKEEFQTPEAVIVYSDSGLNTMSQTFHNLFGKRLARGEWRDKVRPILVNNWEGTYFDFDDEKILNIARAAKEDGIELFVLDDGWFGTRNDDHQGLGDWFSNREKLQDGVEGLSHKIEELGMKFGLWFEPEMVNKNSDLFRKYPDWILHVPGRNQSHGRN